MTTDEIRAWANEKKRDAEAAKIRWRYSDLDFGSAQATVELMDELLLIAGDAA